MKPAIRVISLIIILFVPIIIIGFLYKFGKNRYELPVMNPASADCPPNIGKDSVHRVPPFRFTTQSGGEVSNETFKNKIFVTDFIFTRCASETMCPMMSSQMVRVQEAFRNNPDIKILSHTVDPEYDTAQVLAQYAQRYNADTTQWIFATGKKEEIYKMAQCGYFLPIQYDGTKDLNNAFIHSERFVLVDREGRIRGFYRGNEREEVDRLITEIKILLQENQ